MRLDFSLANGYPKTMPKITVWPSLFSIDNPLPVDLSWPEIVAQFSVHREYATKVGAPGFGPYRLQKPPLACRRHPGMEEHRCVSSVAAVTLAVFDADSPRAFGAMEACDALLERAGLARHWYSTYSHSEAAPAARLLIPLERPVAPGSWPAFRGALIRRYGIPALPEACSGASHFYHSPSCPPGGLAEAWFFSAGGGEIEPPASAPREATPYELGPVALPEEPAGGAGAAAVAEAHRALAIRERALRKAGRLEQAEWARRVGAGEALAERGARNVTTTRVCMALAHYLPGYSVGTLRALLQPAVVAMVAEGSSITEEQVEQMLSSAMWTKAEADAKDEAIRRALWP